MFIGVIKKKTLSHPFICKKHSFEIAGIWGNLLFDSNVSYPDFICTLLCCCGAAGRHAALLNEDDILE